MSWFWMNMPLAFVFFAAWSGIPLYMVLRHRSWSEAPADSREATLVASAAGEGRAPVGSSSPAVAA
jgi:hypothetical protein